jgi:hypothetical protein
MGNRVGNGKLDDTPTMNQTGFRDDGRQDACGHRQMLVGIACDHSVIANNEQRTHELHVKERCKDLGMSSPCLSTTISAMGSLCGPNLCMGVLNLRRFSNLLVFMMLSPPHNTMLRKVFNFKLRL